MWTARIVLQSQPPLCSIVCINMLRSPAQKWRSLLAPWTNGGGLSPAANKVCSHRRRSPPKVLLMAIMAMRSHRPLPALPLSVPAPMC